ncbi:MAG: ATP-binding protein [Desulfuromonadaceae bacterium]|nr:ATP-binding protein [Desulfuromonadaceae bacterium]MDD5106354.1 ATP-binding protein [Desulfuromonadaceae bacterium]
MDQALREQLKRVLDSIELLLPRHVGKIDWECCHAANWRRHSLSGYLDPVPEIEGIHLDDLLGIEEQKQALIQNTSQFLKKFPSNNALLWGTRGTGKSSLVRALLNYFAPEGLRIIQVDKDDLAHLPIIVDSIKHEPYRYIIFSDDVSFEVGEVGYKMLKSALDGSVYAPPENTRIYITSNRRHLMPEYETDNRGAMLVNNEIHHGEAVEEKISLSGRFGLWIGFHPFSQEQYIDVARQWVTKLCRHCDIATVWDKDAEKAAIAWGYSKGDNSGRIASQFATDWVGAALLRHSAPKAGAK